MPAVSETKSFRVPDMSCGHCETAVTEEIARVPGVTAVDVDLGTKWVTVRGENLHESSLREAITDAGYESEA